MMQQREVSDGSELCIRSFMFGDNEQPESNLETIPRIDAIVNLDGAGFDGLWHHITISCEQQGYRTREGFAPYDIFFRGPREDIYNVTATQIGENEAIITVKKLPPYGMSADATKYIDFSQFAP